MAASRLSLCNINNAWNEGLADSGISFRPCTDWQHNKLFNRFSIQYQQLATLPRATRRALQRQWRHTIAGIAILMALGSPAMAATIRVNNNCSLVDAITAANTDTATGSCRRGNGADQIILPANSTQTLTTVNNSTYADGSNGLPVVESIITIVGNGSTITRDDTAPRFRILAVHSDGDLTLQDSTISGGFEQRGFPGGGGISNNGLLTITNSNITNNRAYFNGGGISNDGVLTILDSTISNNLASERSGGGIFNRNELIIQNTQIIDNFSDYPGGGIANYGNMTITRSTVSDNFSLYFGGGLANHETAIVSGSTISKNVGYSAGGGIYNTGTLTVTNSTISANNTQSPEFGLVGGGGLYNCNNATLINTTISGNTSSPNGGGVKNADVDFYFYCNSSDTASLTLNNTLISGNDLYRPYNIYGHEITSNASISTNDFNLIGHSGLTNAEAIEGFAPSATGITATSDGTDPTALAAILDTMLADNGGPTQTHALVSDSPAIDAVTDSSCPPPANDQRGVVRPQDGNDDNSADCDIGAYEFHTLLNVNIDFKPGNMRNPINPQKQGGVWVAVLSSDANAPFDPTSQVDISTILFGPGGAEVIRNKVKDINKDGIGDLLLRFKIPDSGIMCGDVEATLSGETFSGDSIQGSDLVQTRGCK